MTEIKFDTWNELKALLEPKHLNLQYTEDFNNYYIFAIDDTVIYKYTMFKDTPVEAEQTDFETNYKSDCNKPIVPVDKFGKKKVMASSLPDGATTWFSGAGDSETEIGGGKEIKWDFSNSEDDITAPEGFKRKRIDFSFIDNIWLKDGTIYFFNKSKNSYIEMMIVCPKGQYYKKNDGSYALATEDTVVSKYVNKQHVQGDCPMGDELNTETCSDEIPPIYKFRIEITVPDTDIISNGYTSIEVYRKRSVIL